MSVTLKHLQDNVIPGLQKVYGDDTEALKKAIRAVLKQGEEEVPVVNEQGEPVEIEEIILVGAPPAEEEAAEDETAEVMQESIDAAVEKAVGHAMKSLAVKTGKKITGGGFRNDDTARHGWKSIGEFGCAVAAAAMPGSKSFDERLYTKAPTGMQQTVGSDGGFAVPPEFSTLIWDELNNQDDSLMGRTDSYTVTGESLTMNANAETSRATGSRYGGVQGYWIAEADQITSSKPTLRQLKLEPQQLAVLVYATDKLLKNAPAMEQHLSRASVDEINFLVGDSIVNGDGAGQPLGILNSACEVSIAKETGQAANTIVKANIDKMWARCHARARSKAVWLINQDIEPQLEALSADVGTGGVPVYLPAGGIADTPNARLKGRPVVPIEFCATLGTVGDIILADLSAYATGTSGTIDSASSMHLRFDFAETAFRFMFAVDGQPWLASAITPFKGTNTLSPFVTLATRA